MVHRNSLGSAFLMCIYLGSVLYTADLVVAGMAVVAVVVVDWQDSNTAWKQKQHSCFSPLLVTTTTEQ